MGIYDRDYMRNRKQAWWPSREWVIGVASVSVVLFLLSGTSLVESIFDGLDDSRATAQKLRVAETQAERAHKARLVAEEARRQAELDANDARRTSSERIEEIRGEQERAKIIAWDKARQAATASQAGAEKTSAAALPWPIALNAASANQLDQIPGIGPVRAQAIIAARPFQTVDELTRVRGIGRETLSAIRPYITVVEKRTEDDRPASRPSLSP